MSRKTLWVEIESITVFENGDVPGQQAPGGEDKRNAVIASLTYPRSGAPSITSGQQYNLPKNAPMRPDASDFFSCGLFKEEVLEETILQVKVTDTDRVSKIEKFFAAVLAAVFGAAFGVATGGLSKFFGAIAGFGVDQVKGSIAGAGDEVFVIGQTDKVRLHVDTLPQNPAQPLRMNLALIIPEEVRKPFFTIENGAAVQRELVLAKGMHNGNIIIALHVTSE
jgi:hypothetical protein